MPLIHPRATLEPARPGGLYVGAPVASMYTAAYPAQTKPGNTNLHVLGGGPQIGRVHCYDLGQGNFREYWVLFQPDAYQAAVEAAGNELTAEWVGGGGTAWAVLRAQYKNHAGNDGSWRWFQVDFSYPALGSQVDNLAAGPWAKLLYGGTEVGALIRLKPNGTSSPTFQEHWLLSDLFNTPTNGTTFAISPQTASKTGPELRDRVNAIGGGNSEYVFVDTTTPAAF